MTPRMYFERRLGFHRLDHRVCEGFVKLDGRQRASSWVRCHVQNLLQNLHRQLWRDGAARDELVQRVGESHANAARSL